MSIGNVTCISLSFGALAPTLHSQLYDYHLDKELVKHFDKDRDAINRCRIRGLMSDGEADRAQNRLMKKIVKAIEAKS